MFSEHSFLCGPAALCARDVQLLYFKLRIMCADPSLSHAHGVVRSDVARSNFCRNEASLAEFSAQVEILASLEAIVLDGEFIALPVLIAEWDAMLKRARNAEKKSIQRAKRLNVPRDKRVDKPPNVPLDKLSAAPAAAPVVAHARARESLSLEATDKKALSFTEAGSSKTETKSEQQQKRHDGNYSTDEILDYLAIGASCMEWGKGWTLPETRKFITSTMRLARSQNERNDLLCLARQTWVRCAMVDIRSWAGFTLSGMKAGINFGAQLEDTAREAFKRHRGKLELDRAKCLLLGKDLGIGEIALRMAPVKSRQAEIEELFKGVAEKMSYREPVPRERAAMQRR